MTLRKPLRPSPLATPVTVLGIVVLSVLLTLPAVPEASGSDAAKTSAAVIEPGLVSDFADGPKAARGYGRWLGSTDERMGGTSTVDLAVSDGTLRIRGEIRSGSPHPWAGAMWFAGGTPMEPVDLVGVSALAFRARSGDAAAGVLRVFAFAPELGMVPSIQSVEISGDWRQVEVPLSDFGLSGDRITAFLIGGSQEPGPFEIRIDDVELLAAARP